MLPTMERREQLSGERLLNYGRARLVAVFDSPSGLQSAIEQLTEAGLAKLFDAQCGIAGARLIDFSGENHGYLGSLSHSLHHLTVEGEYMDRYERELQAGRCIITVQTHGLEDRNRILDILKNSGGHYINHFGLWAVETVQP